VRKENAVEAVVAYFKAKKMLPFEYQSTAQERERERERERELLNVQ